eukprot:10102858-Heterocapsa_arctica.AAC.1
MRGDKPSQLAALVALNLVPVEDVEARVQHGATTALEALDGVIRLVSPQSRGVVEAESALEELEHVIVGIPLAERLAALHADELPE